MSIEQIKNYMSIAPRIATSGQPQDHEFKWIAQAGFKVVINLAMPNSDDAIPEEGYLVSAYKMTYIHIPVPFDAPTEAQLVEFLQLMNIYDEHPVWVHCALNYRVSAFMYHYYRHCLNQSEAEARATMLPSWQPNPIWQEFLALTPDLNTN